MKPTRPLVLGIVAVILASAGWLATVVGTRYGLATPVLPPSGLVTMGVIAALTLVLGIRILRWRTGLHRCSAALPASAWRHRGRPPRSCSCHVKRKRSSNQLTSS